MAWFIGQSLAFIVVAFLLGLLVGWLIWARRTERSTESPAAEVEAATTEEPAQAEEPAEEAVAVAVAPEAVEVVAAEVEAVEVADAAGAPVAAVAPEKPAKRVQKPVKKATGGTPDDPELDEAVAAEVVAEAEAVARAAAEGTAEAGDAEDADAPGAGPEDAAAAAAADADADATARPEEAAAVVEEPQDLQRIEGIGPKIEAALKAAGITTYAKVAAATEAELRTALRASGIRFAPAASSWSAQAEYLVSSDEKGLEEYQDYLVAGQDRARKFDAKVDYADVDEIEGQAAKAAAIAQDDAEAAALAAAPEPEPEPQDLQRLEGIGPKIESALKAAGITTYARVAAATEAELREALQESGITFAPAAASWSDQAQYLVDGDELGLEEYQDYLVGGQDRARKFDAKVDYADVDEIEGQAAKASALAQDDAEAAAETEVPEPGVQA
ncbi:helix-hairpin-helix domain-containing protein [Antribacter sp. KLBMP9083]|uniref:Helix-hairpin-helix domain-containing protein n=1 Tax=Antribacter soli TaxID=2910976 RepID=A0AA41U9F1_9MICO|nr:helix-hairpin-helix domain-containing protein [Antribacter soli]MCF4121547.1 helix-hairpin-helix domain-containing protein [Antribacter soli]